MRGFRVPEADARRLVRASGLGLILGAATFMVVFTLRRSGNPHLAAAIADSVFLVGVIAIAAITTLSQRPQMRHVPVLARRLGHQPTRQPEMDTTPALVLCLGAPIVIAAAGAALFH